MKPERRLKPVPVRVAEPGPPLNRDLSREQQAELRRRVLRAEKRPAPGSSDLLAATLWQEEMPVGARTVHVYDLLGMPSVALKRDR
jgi:hypothetical protein